MSRKLPKRLIFIIVAALITVACATGGTLAYIFTGTPSVENSFEPVHVTCKVLEEFDGQTKSDVKIKNTGDISAYIRATFVVMWVAEDGSVLSTAPIKDTDYSLAIGSSDWTLGSDGFYYYTRPVASGESTGVLIESISLKGTAPSGYSLNVHVAATAIQSNPASAVSGAWGVQVISNGSLLVP